MFYFKIKPLSENYYKPTRENASDAGLDVYATENRHLNPGDRFLMKLGFTGEFPEGYVCDVRPRSGNALKKGLTVLNTPGTIDCFSIDMKIKTAEGEKNIHDIKINEIIPSINEETVELENDMITGILDKGEIELIQIETEDGMLEITKNTPVYTKDGLKYADELKENDEIIFFN